MIFKDLSETLLNSKYGLFCNFQGENIFIDAKNCLGLIIKRKKVDFDNQIIFQVEIINNSRKEIKLFSILIAGFLLNKFLPSEVLENSWTQSGFSGYKKGVKPTRKRKFFLIRDQNPFSFKKEYGYLENSHISEWYTHLLGEEESLLIGAITTKKQFSQVFIKKEKDSTRIRVTSQLDGLILKPGETIFSEKIAIVYGEPPNSLKKFANLVKKENKINNLPKPIRGLCCAYYYQGNYVDEKYVLEQLKAIDDFPRKPQFDVVLIDGISPPWGDWEEGWKRLFPKGLDYIVKEIEKRGFIAGFWISPYVASPKSNLFRFHPDWFLKDEKGNYFEARLDSPFDFLPFLSLRSLDSTNPSVQEHVSRIIKKMVSYGFKYIKVDFTYPVCFSTNYYYPMTRAQALRLGFETIRNAAGRNVLIQSAINQLSPLIGMVDYCRVGLDTLNPYACKIPILNKLVNGYMLRQNLRSCEARNFLHGKVWINDPDCVVFRKGTGISECLINKHKEFSLRNKLCLWVGDSYVLLKKEEKEMVYNFLDKSI